MHRGFCFITNNLLSNNAMTFRNYKTISNYYDSSWLYTKHTYFFCNVTNFRHNREPGLCANVCLFTDLLRISLFLTKMQLLYQ